MPVCKKIKYFHFTELYLEIKCDRNKGGTRNLVLRGNDLIKKIGRRVNNSDLIIIVDFLRKHPEVVALDFPYNEISDCGMSTLVDFFKERPGIRHLNLIGNNIGPRGIGYLASMGELLPLFSLRLTGNKFGKEGGIHLSKLLFTKTALRYLDLSDTDQTMSSLAYIMTALMPSRGGTNTLEYVDLGRPLPQEYHQVCDSHAAEFIGQVIKENSRLKELHIQQYGFDFRDMEIMTQSLYHNTTLVCLDLNNNNIGDDGVDYLCKYLRTSPQLECLMIGANNFSDIGATALSFNLPFSKIKLLDITHNRITDEGMILIFYTIKKIIKMRALFIWGNKLTHKSLVVLQRLFHSQLLNPETTDVELYCADKELRAAWNPHANRYTNRFYCVWNYEFQKIKNLPPPPLTKPPIYYKYHVDDAELGFPVCEWQRFESETKYIDPV